MKVLLINGSPHPDGCTHMALNEVATTLNKEGVETEIIYLGNQPVAGCIACNSCRKTGRCIRNDQVNEILERLDTIDGIVLGSPVYYSQPTGQILSFSQRLFYASAGRMYGKVGASVVSCRRGGATATFECLNQIFLMNNMVLASSQYWNQVHGNSPEEEAQDLEGLQTMRTLGQNIAWILKGLANTPKPEYEPRQSTNFIR